MNGEDILVSIVKLLGPEKAGDFFLGEPVRGRDAWILLDHLRKYNYETILEDEDEECYVLVMRVAGKYIYILLKNGDSSRGYLVQAITPADYKTASKLALEEYNKCLEKEEEH